jgi:hypothetical protein
LEVQLHEARVPRGGAEHGGPGRRGPAALHAALHIRRDVQRLQAALEDVQNLQRRRKLLRAGQQEAAGGGREA